MKVRKLTAQKILDSSGEWTLRVRLVLNTGQEGAASVPSGISEGRWEAKTVPADQAVEETKKVVWPALSGQKIVYQKEIDRILEKLPCGANTALAVSLAFCRAAKTLSFPPKIIPPRLMVLLFEGGKHGAKNLTIQEFMAVVDNLDQGVEAYQKIKKFLEDRGLPTTVGVEGGFSPPGVEDEEVLGIIRKILGQKVALALDVAANFQKKLEFDYLKWVKEYSLVSLEDPYPDNDWEAWVGLTEKIGDQIMVVGDDLTATAPARIAEAAERKAINAVIIKPDQRRTLTGALKAVETAKENGLKIIVSHRGKETNDSFIADLALAVQADFVKFGAPVRGERVAKYNRLLLREEEMLTKVVISG